LYLCSVKSILSDIISDLRAVYPAEEARELAYWILEESTGLSRTEILTADKITKNIPNYKVILQRILKKEPIQYIFGHTRWCGLDLKVTPATLIPRPETAELVSCLSDSSIHRFTDSPKVLDIGTGTGCIAILLKQQHPDWQVSAMDISGEALAVAKENALKNSVEINFFQGDVFTDEIGEFDLIVSNPPYVMESEKKDMDTNVLDYEPASALFVSDNDPLRFYRRIAEIKKARYVAFEINQALGQEMVALMENLGYTDIQLKQDSYGNDRILLARLNE